MAAAAITKTRLLKTQCSSTHTSIWKRHIKHSIPNHPLTPRNSTITNHHHLINSTRFPKIKDLEVSNKFFSSSSRQFSSSSSSSSQKSSGFVGWYLTLLNTRPIPTKCVTASLIYSAADISSQTISGEDSENQYDFVRTLRMGGYGLLILGPAVHYWYNYMSRVFPKRDLLSTFKKIGLGQTSFGPAMTVVFFSVNAALQGESCSEIVARLKRDLLPTIINGIMYWPVCDFVTFKFIPVHLQPLVANSFSYLWTVYMTYMASLAKVGAS